MPVSQRADAVCKELRKGHFPRRNAPPCKQVQIREPFSSPYSSMGSTHETKRAFSSRRGKTPFPLIFSSTVYGSVEDIHGGAKGIRTPDLLNAIQALSQLSYSPIAQRGVFYTPDSILSIKRGLSSGNRYRSRPKAEIAWSAYRNDGTLSALSAAYGVPFMQTGR